MLVNPDGKNTIRPQEKITKIIIMGRVAKRVYQVIFDINRGKVYQVNGVPYGQEYSHQEQTDAQGNFLGWLNPKPVGGWRQGILNAPYPGPKLKRIDNGTII
jgi:hypothetical protein